MCGVYNMMIMSAFFIYAAAYSHVFTYNLDDIGLELHMHLSASVILKC